jgi:hypothetical protein
LDVFSYISGEQPKKEQSIMTKTKMAHNIFAVRPEKKIIFVRNMYRDKCVKHTDIKEKASH